VHTKMKSFAERNPMVIGAIGVALTAGLVLGSLYYDKLPLVNRNHVYSAYFTESGGLNPGTPVQVSGYKVGQVRSVDLDGARVLVTFDVSRDIELGDRTEATIKTESLLGTKTFQVSPRGTGQLSGPIPVERTQPPYQLPEALGDVTTAISGLDTHQVSDALSVLAQTFQDTPPELRDAVQGVQRFSKTVNARDEQLRNLLANANKATTVLAQRSGQIVSLVSDTNGLLTDLKAQGAALDRISSDISALTRQLKGTISENRATWKPALDKLNGALAIVDNRKADVQTSIKKLNAYAMSLGESVSSGPFFQAYIVNLLPGQFVQPFIDAAFSDLGLDPNVRAPSELADPPTGQPGTPALPPPYPRTGQGGDPRTHLPDAITGNPGDPRYPYREPPPQPAPGGPPPGPPADAPRGLASTPVPSTPTPIFVPAPNEPSGPPHSDTGGAPGPTQGGQ
jgi:phospholipid/cholesterol/gamma-HCH transport system substrate-binding protein